jgi:iron complex outermembrane receptor protein
MKIESVACKTLPVLFLLISFSLFAQQKTENPESESQQINFTDSTEHINIQEIVVKAFGSEKRLFDTPGSIGVLTNRQITREPSFTLAPVMNKISGVWMQSGTMTTNRLTIRGIGTRSAYSTNKIRAYFGDIPLTNGVGETTLEDLELEQIADIEILKGPASGFYGSGLGGVLLFNPLMPARTQFSQNTSVGSFGTLKYSGKLTLAEGKTRHSLVYSRFHSDGYRQNNEANRHNLTWTSTYSHRGSSVSLLGMFVKNKAFIPSSIDLKTFKETPEKAAANWFNTRGFEYYQKAFGGITFQQEFAHDWLLKLSGFGHFNANDELRPFNILQEKNHYIGQRSTLEKKISSGKTTSRIMIGSEFFSENYKWQTLQNNNREAGKLLSDNWELRWYNNIFLMTDLNVEDRLIVSASINWNRTNYDYKDRFLSDGDQGGQHKFPHIVSPRLATTWLVNQKTRLFSVVSHGFSPPTLEETLLPGGLRNTAIKPETGWNFEIGTKGSVGKSLFYEVSAYYMKVKNLLVAQRTGEDEYMGINAGGTNHPGIEIKLDYQLVNSQTWTSFFKTTASYTPFRFADFTDKGNDFSGNKLTGSPELMTNWMLETSHSKGFFVHLHYQTVGRIPLRDDNSIFTEAYSLGNIMAGYEKTFRKLSVGVSTGLQNLFNTHNASMVLINATAIGTQSPRYYYPGLPRNFKSTLNLRYFF